MRAFVALEIDEGFRGRLGALMGQLQGELRGLRWLDPRTLHLTLRFLGSASPEALERMQESLAAAASRCPPVPAATSGLGVFPLHGSPHVLWLAFELPEAVRELQKGCERAAVQAGFPPEPRTFRPHLTLGRWRERASRPQLPSVDLGVAWLDRVVLFRSELHPAGAVHSPLATFPLGGAPSDGLR